MTPQVYVYAWGNNERRAALKGRRCVIEARGGMRTVLVRFLDTGERVTTSIRALRREVFPTENALSRIYGGGGNRTRVSGNPDAPDLQGERASVPADPARPRLSNTKIPHRGRPAKRAGDWAMLDARGSSAATRAVVPTTKVSGTVTSRLSPPDAHDGGGLDRRVDARPLLCTPAACEAEAVSPHKEISDSRCRCHRGGLRLHGVARPHCKVRYQHAALVCAPVDDRHVALRGGVARVGRGRDAGVGLESVSSLPVDDGLSLHRLEQLRDPAGEPVPVSVAGTTRGHVACAGAVADLVCEAPARLTVGRARVQTRPRLVLTGAAA